MFEVKKKYAGQTKNIVDILMTHSGYDYTEGRNLVVSFTYSVYDTISSCVLEVEGSPVRGIAFIHCHSNSFQYDYDQYQYEVWTLKNGVFKKTRKDSKLAEMLGNYAHEIAPKDAVNPNTGNFVSVGE